MVGSGLRGFRLIAGIVISAVILAIFASSASGADCRFSDLEVRPGGQAIAAGSCDAGLTLVQLTAGGDRDGSFGEEGETVLPAASGTGVLMASLSPNGDLTIGSGSALTRIDESGQLVTDFGNGGIAALDFGNPGSDTYPEAIAAYPDGSTVISANIEAWSGQPAGQRALARYTDDGQFDTTFGTGGLALTSLVPTSVATGPGAKIFAASLGSTVYAESGTQDAAMVSRFTANGDLDTAYGTGGTGSVTMPWAQPGGLHTNVILSDLIVETDGSATVSGQYGMCYRCHLFGFSGTASPTGGSVGPETLGPVTDIAPSGRRAGIAILDIEVYSPNDFAIFSRGPGLVSPGWLRLAVGAGGSPAVDAEIAADGSVYGLGGTGNSFVTRTLASGMALDQDFGSDKGVAFLTDRQCVPYSLPPEESPSDASALRGVCPIRLQWNPAAVKLGFGRSVRPTLRFNAELPPAYVPIRPSEVRRVVRLKLPRALRLRAGFRAKTTIKIDGKRLRNYTWSRKDRTIRFFLTDSYPEQASSLSIRTGRGALARIRRPDQFRKLPFRLSVNYGNELSPRQSGTQVSHSRPVRKK